MDDVKLKPCPLCGGEADLMIPEADSARLAVAMCMSCYCIGRECETEDQAVAAWNTRTPDATCTAERDRLREAFEPLVRKLWDLKAISDKGVAAAGDQHDQALAVLANYGDLALSLAPAFMEALATTEQEEG